MKVFIIRWCPEAYGQWTLDSSHVDWWKVAHAASLQMLFGKAKTMVVEARKKGTWVLLQNCHLYKKLGWQCSPCFTQLRYIYRHSRLTIHAICHLPVSALLALVGTMWSTMPMLIESRFDMCLLSSNSPSLLAVRQSRLHTYSRLFKLAFLAIDYCLLSFLQVLRFVCSLTQAENAAATIKEHGFLKSCQASNNFRLCMTFLYTMLVLLSFQTVFQGLPGP